MTTEVNSQVAAVDNLLLEGNWYHAIELKPGVYTPGFKFPNIAMTRRMLKGCEVEGATCLDVGAMDGFVSALLARRGAARVFACDRYNRRSKIDIVARSLGLNINYLSGVSLADVRRIAPSLIENPFDLIVFSGVLYHMYDPMNGLGLIRSMVRPGGLVVVETQAVKSKEMVSYFNANGLIADDCHNYWNMSVELLDYLLRYFRLKALDCCYYDMADNVLRISIACEAVTTSLADPGDTFMSAPARDDDADYPTWGNCRGRPLSYTPSTPAASIRRPSGAVNLYEALQKTPPTPYGDRDVVLALADRS
jgi:SAM-dependent methyltransferase